MARLAAALEKVSASRPQRMDSLLELVTNSLLRLHDENQEDRSRRLQQQRDRMLLSLLLGGFGGTEQQEILRQMMLCGLDTPHSRFQCVLLEYSSADETAPALCANPPEAGHAVCWLYLEPSLHTCVYLLSSGKLSLRRSSSTSFGSTGTGFSVVPKLPWALPVSGLGEISRSYQSARQALRGTDKSLRGGSDIRRQLRGDIAALCEGYVTEIMPVSACTAPISGAQCSSRTPQRLPVPLRRTFLPAAAGTAPKPGKPTLLGTAVRPGLCPGAVGPKGIASPGRGHDQARRGGIKG